MELSCDRPACASIEDDALGAPAGQCLTVGSTNCNRKSCNNNYCNCFIERESSAQLCFELQAMNQKIYQEIDVWRLEDAQFDMLIGKECSDPRFASLNSKQAIQEVEIL